MLQIFLPHWAQIGGHKEIGLQQTITSVWKMIDEWMTHHEKRFFKKECKYNKMKQHWGHYTV